jgi:hypothetical protein
MMKFTTEQAQHCAKIFIDYFEKFDRIDEYMRDQKLSQLSSDPPTLMGMGFEEDFFSDFTMHPNDMDIEVYQIPSSTWCTMLNMVSSHTNMASIPGRELRYVIREKNTRKVLGFIRLQSPLINCKPRNVLLGAPPNLSNLNNSTIMGMVIVPVQPFGFNYLGGKLLAGICCSHFVRDEINKKYGSNVVMFETTSLFGNSKATSQYDGMKPYLRNRGLTDSNFIPMLHGKPYHELLEYAENATGARGVGIASTSTSKKLKRTNKIISLIKNALEGEELKTFNRVMKEAKALTERKRYYVSNYGIENYIDIVNGKTDEIIKGSNYDRFELDSIIDWWKKKAAARFETLQKENRLRKELEIWTPNSNIDIIR